LGSDCLLETFDAFDALACLVAFEAEDARYQWLSRDVLFVIFMLRKFRNPR
jgi:hypothetical protein